MRLVSVEGRSVLYDLIVEGFEKTGTLKGAARYAGIAHTTLRDWCRRDQALRNRLDNADDTVTDELYASAIEQALAGNERLIIFLLNARGRGLLNRAKAPSMSVAEVALNLRQMVLAQPTLAPFVRAALIEVLAALP